MASRWMSVAEGAAGGCCAATETPNPAEMDAASKHWPANRYGLKLRDAIFIEDYSCLEALEAGWIAEEQLP
jgi:hypothetical protein